MFSRLIHKVIRIECKQIKYLAMLAIEAKDEACRQMILRMIQQETGEAMFWNTVDAAYRCISLSGAGHFPGTPGPCPGIPGGSCPYAPGVSCPVPPAPGGSYPAPPAPGVSCPYAPGGSCPAASGGTCPYAPGGTCPGASGSSSVTQPAYGGIYIPYSEKKEKEEK